MTRDGYKLFAIVCFIIAGIIAVKGLSGPIIEKEVTSAPMIKNNTYHYKIEGMVPYNGRTYYTNEYWLKEGAIWFYDSADESLTCMSMPFIAKLVKK
jgi:hypothetical protein